MIIATIISYDRYIKHLSTSIEITRNFEKYTNFSPGREFIRYNLDHYCIMHLKTLDVLRDPNQQMSFSLIV